MDSALVLAAQLAKQYLTSRRLPDSAIDLLDEASSAVKVARETRPEAIDVLERQKLGLEVEVHALEREKDEASKEDSIHPVVPAVQDVEITVVPVVAMALVTDKASPGLISLDCLWEWNWSRRRRPWGSAGYQAMESKRFAGSWRQSSSRMDFHRVSCV